MKKYSLTIFAIFLFVFFSLGLVACNNKNLNGDKNFEDNQEKNQENDLNISVGLNFIDIDSETCEVSGIGTCTNKDIVVPSIYNNKSVVSIGVEAFSESEIQSISLPQSITEIKSKAFWFCRNLSKVNFSDKLITIKSFAFAGCKSLTKIKIPKSIIAIEKNAFFYCDNITTYDVDNENAYYSDDGNNLYNKNKTIFIKYAGGQKNYSFSIPTTVLSIDDYAFHNVNLYSVLMNDNVTSIGDDAFSCCENLQTLNLSKNISKIGKSAFSVCVSLREIAIPKKVSTIKSLTFSNCLDLISVTISSSVTVIENYAFYHCEKLGTIYYFGDITDWERINIGDNNESIKNANIIFS